MGPDQRRVILCSAQHWDAPVHLSAHHLASFIAGRGWRVCFLSTPTSPLHRLRFHRDADARARFASWRRGGATTEDGRIHSYTPLALVPPSRLPGLSTPWLLRNWPRLTWPAVDRHLSKAGFAGPDLMIADSALMLPLWQALGRPRLVYRVTDRNQDFPGKPAALDAMEREMAAAAEVVVYTGDSLAAYVEDLGARTALCIPNGVDTAHFRSGHALPREYEDIAPPRAVYVGTIADWFDAALIGKAARALPDIAFVIIGPGGERLAPLARHRNVHILGARPYPAIPGYLEHAQVGLIPFTRREHTGFVDDINPLKLYEYMAAGLPVVATEFRQLRALASPAVLAADDQAFIEAIALAASRPSGGTDERAFAAGFDWTRQFEPLARRLGL